MEHVLRALADDVQKALEGFKNELHSLRTNRPNAKLVEDIRVHYYNQQTPVKHLGSISISPPRDINISIWDANAVKDAAKAIQDSGLGVSVSVEGNLLRITLPVLTEERRKELMKLTSKLAEETRIQIRKLREEANKKIDAAEKEKKISEDQKFKSKEDVQNAVNKANQEVEMLVLKKNAEISD